MCVCACVCACMRVRVNVCEYVCLSCVCVSDMCVCDFSESRTCRCSEEFLSLSFFHFFFSPDHRREAGDV